MTDTRRHGIGHLFARDGERHLTWHWNVLVREGAPVKYLMLIYGNEQIWNSLPADELTTLIREVDAFNGELRASGELVESQGLTFRPRAVRMVGDAPVVTDGPYLEAKEYVGSYFLVDVVSEERALEIARSYPGLRFGTGRSGGGLEVWPLMTGTGGDH